MVEYSWLYRDKHNVCLYKTTGMMFYAEVVQEYNHYCMFIQIMRTSAVFEELTNAKLHE